MSRRQTPEYRREYWKKWYAKNRAKHIAHNTEYNVGRRARIKQFLTEIKLKQGCSECGYKEHPEALEFDHTSDNKSFTVSRAIALGYSEKKILSEIEKCELVCANCHRVRTYNRRQQRLENLVAL